VIAAQVAMARRLLTCAQTREIVLMLNRQSMPAIQVVVLTASADFNQLVRAAFGGARCNLSIVQGGLPRGGETLDVTDAGLVIVDLDSTKNEELWALDLLMKRIARSVPVVVVTQVLQESVPRRLVQMRIADLLVKPVAPDELLSACVRLARTPTDHESMEARIFTFMPAVGGAGATTLAIQAALTLHRTGGRKKTQSTCLVDLNLAHSACADYLDLKPQLDLGEIGRHPDRLDAQLLEVMLSRHRCGLAVVAAPSHLASMHSVNPVVVTRLLDLVSSSFENVVIDMPRTWYPWSDSVLGGSDQVFIITEATVPALRTAKQLATATSQGVGLKSPPLVIVNRFRRWLFSSGLRRADLRGALDESFGGTIPCDYSLVREAIDLGVPLQEVKRGNNIAAAIKKLILNRDSPPAAGVAERTAQATHSPRATHLGALRQTLARSPSRSTFKPEVLRGPPLAAPSRRVMPETATSSQRAVG
jgi:pilus assembly protein CpaE